jgi:hypothetical protein
MNPSEQFVEQGISHQVLIFLHFKYEICHIKAYAWFHFMYQNLKRTSCANVLTLAYQSLGVVYGDLSTYMFPVVWIY